MSDGGGMPDGKGGLSKTMIAALIGAAILAVAIFAMRDRAGYEPSTNHSNGGSVPMVQR